MFLTTKQTRRAAQPVIKSSNWLSHVMRVRQSEREREKEWECTPSIDKHLSASQGWAFFTMFVFLVFFKELHAHEIWEESWPVKTNIWTVVFSQRWAASHMPVWVRRLPLSHLWEVYMCSDPTILSRFYCRSLVRVTRTPKGRRLNLECSLERPQETWDSFACSVRLGPSVSGWEIALGTHSGSIKVGQVSLRLGSWHAAWL